MTLAAEPGAVPQPERITYTTGTGESLSILRFPFQPGRPLLHWAHATGFHATTYRPLLGKLAAHFNVLAWDMRGHGQSPAAADPRKLSSWQPFYDDLEEFAVSLGEPLILAGHSVGAVCSLAVAARLGALMRGLCLVDPILMCGAPGVGFGIMKRLGQGHRHPLVSGALRRQRTFATSEEALNSYWGKRVFSSWQAGFLEAYVEGGFRPTINAVELCCSPEWEAAQFATTEHAPWDWVGRVQCPVLLVQGERDSTIFPGAVRKFQSLHSETRHRRYSGTSHFVPMEAANRLVDEICKHFG